ncbi:MAG TPA: alpha/beta hydrolase [Thermoplasmata archaeon]|nr:alpha/beta hydrolase [Thermoplasmata archaeon]
MPTAQRNGAEVYYEVRGNGPPLVLVEGLGYGLWMWRGQSPALEGKFRLLLVDNRGVGRSSPLTGPYSMEGFARDVLAVLDAEGVDRATVLGASMGGAIAQALAALAPERVSAMVLACTTPGGPTAKPMPPATFAEVTRKVPNESEPDRLRRTMGIAMTPEFPREHAREVDAIVADRLASPTDPTQWMFQALSSATFDACASNARLSVPALITAGTEDRVLPWANSLLLYRMIPHASLALFRGQNHLHLIERATEFNELVSRFLDSVARGALEIGVEEVR